MTMTTKRSLATSGTAHGGGPWRAFSSSMPIETCSALKAGDRSSVMLNSFLVSLTDRHHRPGRAVSADHPTSRGGRGWDCQNCIGRNLGDWEHPPRLEVGKAG